IVSRHLGLLLCNIVIMKRSYFSDSKNEIKKGLDLGNSMIINPYNGLL
ncbi:uncharacterized protein METZ01_LOCUS174837, partial [marine metagenome]